MFQSNNRQDPNRNVRSLLLLTLKLNSRYNIHDAKHAQHTKILIGPCNAIENGHPPDDIALCINALAY